MKKENSIWKLFGCVILVMFFLSFVCASDSQGESERRFFDSFKHFFYNLFGGLTGKVVDGGGETDAVPESSESEAEVSDSEGVSELLVPPLPSDSSESSSDISSGADEESSAGAEGAGGDSDEPVENVLDDVESSVNESDSEESLNESTQDLADEAGDESAILDEFEEGEKNISDSLVNNTINDSLNETLNETISSDLNESRIVEENLMQYGAVIGRPVRWVKKLTVEINGSVDNLSVEIPKQAEDIVVKTGMDAETAGEEVEMDDGNLTEEDREDIAFNIMTGNVISGSERGFLMRFVGWLFSGITGNVVYEDSLEIQVEEDSLKVNLEEVIKSEEGEVEVAVEYYTEAPQASEEFVEGGKRVIVSGPSELGYQNILAYSVLEGDLNIEVSDLHDLKLYWYENGTEEKKVVDYEVFDFDEDGRVDYMEWIVPHLSNQTYEIIVITKAEHLDSSRNFISDIYESVKEQDGNWSEEISDGEYVRITFERSLDNTKDITVYARGSGNGSSSIEVYAENSSELITTISDITGENTYKTLLTNLGEGISYEVFDLKVLGAIEFDWIVDPSVPGPITTCQTLDTPGTYTLQNNVTTTGTCFSITANNVTLDLNGFNITGDGGSIDYGVIATDLKNVMIMNGQVKSFFRGIWFSGSIENSSVHNIVVFNSTQTGVSLTGVVEGVSLYNITSYSNGMKGLRLYASSFNNIYNFESYFNGEEEIGADGWGDSGGNILKYNNSFGEIKFKELSTNIEGTLRFGEGYNVNLVNNSVYVNSSNLTGLNISANVTFYGIGDRGFVIPTILKDGVPCTDCYNFTSLNAGTVIFNVSSWSNYSIGESPYALTNCTTISSPGTYTLQNDITTNETCFTITADNVTLDLNGKSVDGDDSSGSSGITGTSRYNITIINGVITDFGASSFSSPYEGGIYFNGLSNSTIRNVSFSSNSAGISIATGSNNIFDNLSVSSTNSNGYGIIGQTNFNYSNFSNIIVSSAGWQGITLTGSANYNRLVNLTITSSGSAGIGLSGGPAANNYLENVISNGAYGIMIQHADSDNNLFKDCSFSGTTNDTSIDTSGILNTTFINVTYSLNKEYIASGSSLTRKWYYQAYVNYTNGTAVSGANVSAYNVSGAVEFTGLMTNSSGWTNITTITDYVNNGGVRSYYSNYSVNASKGTYIGSQSINVTYEQNTFSNVITLSDPYSLTNCTTISSPGTYILQNDISTTGTCFNITADNVTLDGNGSSIDGDDSGTDYGIYAEGRNNITLKNFTNITDFNGEGIYFEGTNNSFIQNLQTSSNYNGISLSSSSNNSLTSITANSNVGASSGIQLSSSSNNNFTNITANLNNRGVSISSSSNSNIFTSTTINGSLDGGIYFQSSSNNIFYNLQSYNNTNGEVYSVSWEGSTGNSLVYNSSFGEIKFRALSADIEGTLRFGEGYNINIANNSAYLNSSSDISELNVSANITLLGLPTFTNPVILKDGVQCTDCYNFTSLNAGTVIFNVSSWSNYSIGEGSNPYALTNCTTISSPGTYTLQNDVNSTGTCFNITADNVTLDGNGYTLSGDPSLSAIVLNANNSVLKNVNANGFGKIVDFVVGSGSVLVYNNSYGNITFSNLSEDVLGNLSLGGTINISRGAVQIDEGFLALNSVLNSSGANVTFLSVYNYSYPVRLLRMGVAGNICNSSTTPVCANYTPLTASVVRFNVASLWRNLTVGMLSSSTLEIPLYLGWNLVSISNPADQSSLANGVTPTDVNVSLSNGWNLIGYSSPLEEDSFSDIAEFNNSDWSNATSNRSVQKYVPYYNNNGTVSRYEFLGLPDHDSILREARGYWIYSNVNGSVNLTLEGVAFSPSNDSYRVSELMFRNETSGEIVNTTVALLRGFVLSSIYYWDPNRLEDEELRPGFVSLSLSSSTANLSAWRGYFFKSYYSNITTLRMS